MATINPNDELDRLRSDETDVFVDFSLVVRRCPDPGAFFFEQAVAHGEEAGASSPSSEDAAEIVAKERVMHGPSDYRTNSLTEADGGSLTVTIGPNGGVQFSVEEAIYDEDEDGCGCSGGWAASITFSPDNPVDVTALRALKEIVAKLTLPE